MIVESDDPNHGFIIVPKGGGAVFDFLILRLFTFVSDAQVQEEDKTPPQPQRLPVSLRCK